MVHTIVLDESDVVELLREGELSFSGTGECQSGYNNQFTMYLADSDPHPEATWETPTER